MHIFEAIEQTALAEWVRISVVGYPTMITLHSIGLAVMVGISVMVSLRVLGLFERLPSASLSGLFRWAWAGFLVNTGSGISLWAMQAADYVQDAVFVTKFAAVIAGAGSVALLQHQLSGTVSSASLRPFTKPAAIVTILVWTTAMVTGRLVAYQ